MLFLNIAQDTIPLWLSAPFVILLLLIAAGPILFKVFWHQYYKHIATCIGAICLLYYLFILGDTHKIQHTFFEYFSFIALLSALYTTTGGIYIRSEVKTTPLANVTLLTLGAILANVIGTTGASVLLIRPFLRMNQHRFKPYLVIFFIFIVSNVGGALTPIGDPPLFLGFLKGVPFEWTLIHLFPIWLFTLGILLTIFLVLDANNNTAATTNQTSGRLIKIEGGRNLLWLLAIVGSVFLDPAKLTWLPSIQGQSFIREVLQLTLAYMAYRTADREALYYNRFNFEPILEVIFIFFGIFFSMMPALQFLEKYVATPGNLNSLSPSLCYWATGTSSSVLDNAPAYLTMLTASLTYYGFSINDASQVSAFALSEQYMVYVKAVSVSAVFFGAMTYIGNGPNFMVKSIVEESHKEMPSFVAYTVKYSMVYLLPVLVLVWYIFIY
jgi:Na+/H+ antiporter NhaD/arsenite permease-like protein